MARIRSIKPEFWTDEKVVTLSPFARLVFIGLWNFVDDHGRAPCSPSRMKMQILPADAADFPQLLEEISGIGLITIYTVDGKQFLQVNGFDKHQKIDKRVKSKYPDPPISADLPRILSLEGIKEGIKEGISADAIAPPQISTAEADYFRRVKEIVGSAHGGALAKKLLMAKGNSVPLARAAAEQASTKQDPREYLGAIIRNRDSPGETENGRAF